MDIYLNFNRQSYHIFLNIEDYPNLVHLFINTFNLDPNNDILNISFEDRKVKALLKESGAEWSTELQTSEKLELIKDSILSIFNNSMDHYPFSESIALELLSKAQLEKFQKLYEIFGNRPELKNELLKLACKDPKDPEQLTFCQLLTTSTLSEDEKTSRLHRFNTWLNNASSEDIQTLLPFLSLKSAKASLILDIFDESLFLRLKGPFGQFIHIYDRFNVDIEYISHIKFLADRFAPQEFQKIHHLVGDNPKDASVLLETLEKIPFWKNGHQYMSLAKYLVHSEIDQAQITPNFIHWLENKTAKEEEVLLNLIEMDLFGFEMEDIDPLDFHIRSIARLETFFELYSTDQMLSILHMLTPLTKELRETAIAILLIENPFFQDFKQKLQWTEKWIQFGFTLYEIDTFLKESKLDQPSLSLLLELDIGKNEMIYLSKLLPQQFQEMLELKNIPTDRYAPTTFIVHQSQIAAFYKATDSQNEYGKRMGRAIEMGQHLIQQGKRTFDEILDFLAMQRSALAVKMNHRDQNLYGENRNTEFHSLTRPPYTELSTHLFKFYQDLATNPIKGLKIAEPLKFKYLATINGKEVDLSIVDLKNYNANIEPSNVNAVRIDHTVAKNIKPIKTHLKSLYDQALQEDDPVKLMEKLGGIFWWICQAKPWKLGDPSIAEMFVRSIWTAKGHEPSPWKVGLVPWIEVMKEPDVSQFSKNFSSFFDIKQT